MYHIIKNIILVVVFLSSMASCENGHGNQNSGKDFSDSGNYMCAIYVVERLRDGEPKERLYWKVDIYNKKKKLEFEEVVFDLSGHFSVYWGWEGDVLWIYNSDNGRVMKWSLGDAGWLKQKVISHSSGGWKSKIKGLAGLASPEPSLFGLQLATL